MLKIAYTGFPRYLSLPILSSIAKETHKYAENFYIDISEETPEEHVPENFGMTVRINRKFVETALADIKSRKVLSTLKSVKALREHIDARLLLIDPDAIVATSDMGGLVTRLCNEWAVKHGRPFFIMQPSFIEVAPEKMKNKISRIAIYLIFNKLFRTPIGRRQHYYGNERKSNYLLLWSSEFANQIRDNAIAKNTFCVGNPLLDKFANQKVRIDVKEPVVLICTQPYNKLMDMGILTRNQVIEMYGMLWGIISQNPGIHFIIKVHPSEDIKTYSMVIFGSQMGANYSITQTASMSDLLKVADVQVSMASYTSFEAVVAGVPIIILHPEFMKFFNQFDGVAQNVDNIETFNVLLRRLLRKLGRECFAIQRKEYLNKKLSYFGNSAEVTANTIRRVVEWKKPGFR